MLDSTTSTEASRETTLTLVDRVRGAIAELSTRAGVRGADVWARSAGPHVLLGLCDEEAFARLTPLGGTLFGLAFRAAGRRPSQKNSWEPMLLVDELVDVVEHAIVAIEAVPIQ